MAKTKDKVQEEPEAPVEETAPAKAPPSVDPTCLSCKFLSQGLFGPTCINPASPNYDRHMREQDTCEEHTTKA